MSFHSNVSRYSNDYSKWDVLNDDDEDTPIVYFLSTRPFVNEFWAKALHDHHDLFYTNECGEDIIGGVCVNFYQIRETEGVSILNKLAHDYNLSIVVGVPTVGEGPGKWHRPSHKFGYNIEMATEKSLELAKRGLMKEAMVMH